MSLYDGFFDAEKLDGQFHEDGSQKYDREYGPGDFVSYFANIIGSGVCVHNNPDSFLVRLKDGQAVVSPGYLFIQGYWLKNNADYPISLPGSGNYAIVAHLNLGARMIELEARAVEAAYTDSLVLALVGFDSGVLLAEDTRHNTDLCGVIDTAGELSTKVEWAINYIDNEIESKLAAVERDIATQSAKLDTKIAAVQAVADSITPPPVGTIKFSAAQNVGEEWLRCDGSFVNEAYYPELVEALGKLTPSADKVQLLSNGEIDPQISNGVVYDGRMWAYSYSSKKLYGVDLEGGGIKVIGVTSADPDFTMAQIPSTARPIALSIVKSPVDSTASLFLAQIQTGRLWIYSAEFSSSSNSITVAKPFTSVSGSVNYDSNVCVPYVISNNVGGVETFSTAIGSAFSVYGTICELNWTAAKNSATATPKNTYTYGEGMRLTCGQRTAFSSKSKNESVFVYALDRYIGQTHSYYTTVASNDNGIFTRANGGSSMNVEEILGTPGPLNIVGEDKVLFEPSTSAALVISLKDLDIPHQVDFGLSLPSGARTFVDAGAYLWGKDMYMLFVGTGIIFSRTLEDGSFGYLDTTDILGQITQFGYLDYSQDESALYLMGQDTTNTVKVAKIVLNTLYDYANDGAWLPMLASDGVPAYIKAYDPDAGSGGGGGTDMSVKVTFSGDFTNYCQLFFNDEALQVAQTYTRKVFPSGSFTVSAKSTAKYGNTNYKFKVNLNGTNIISIPGGSNVGTSVTKTFKTSDYLPGGITLSCTIDS